MAGSVDLTKASSQTEEIRNTWGEAKTFIMAEKKNIAGIWQGGQKRVASRKLWNENRGSQTRESLFLMSFQ